ncbi:prolyl oligopeptidase family serine peptidase [Ekhidna sp.]|uniref:carboxylesterase family protein n=1 Tax=Ekhidna sp. TaxID=2608089 RepID=UPI0032998D14
MTRKFFSSAILLGSLYTLVVLTTSLISFLLGQRLGESPSFGSWYLIQWLVSIVWFLILLKYLHQREYIIAFWSLAVLTCVTIVNFILSIKVFSTNEITNSYVVVAHFLPITLLLFGANLALSKTKERYWLKAAGISICLFGLFNFMATVWMANSLTALHDGSGTKVTQWISIMEIPILILLLLNFFVERQGSKPRNSKGQISNAINFFVFAAFLTLAFYGFKIKAETKKLSATSNYSAYEQKLANPFKSRTYKNDQEESLSYRLLIPRNYDSNKSYPLVIALHGASGRGNDNVKQVSRSFFAQLLSKPHNQIKYPAFVLVPQCPPCRDWGGITNIKSVDHLVLEIISELETEFVIDKKRRYITGISMGGFGTWHLISSQPEMFAAAIPICGAGNPEFADKLTDIPIWAFHGEKDRNVLVKGSRDMINAIRDKGGNPKYTEYPDKAHHISISVENTPELIDWLFSQKR